MNQKLVPALIITSIVCVLSSCTTHKEEGERATIQRGEQNIHSVTIAYEKYQLENGLTVILHEDDSDPLVHVDVTYHVGSAREELGRSGFAHFFEHMMFQGSEHIADEQHFKIVTEAGGDLNGTTNRDRTNYYQTIPANQLERILWLESDRMGFLLGAVTQKKFEVQRDTVKNERAQRIDNQPYGLRSELTAEALYPVGHPYSWPTIGYIEDLERVGVEDLKQFFTRWYGPNNAVLTIGGSFDKTQVKQWVQKYFSEIPRGPNVQNIDKTPVYLKETRYITHEDQVHLPLIQETLPTVHVRHPDEAPLDVLADILGGGKTSLLYKNLVKSGDAVQALVAHPCNELACEFQIIALANPRQTPNLNVLQQKIEASLLEFETRGVLDDDLQRTKASIEAGTIFGLQSVAGKVSLLAANETFHGEPDLVEENLARYNAVTSDDVLRVYKKYVKDKPSVVLSIVPKGASELAAQQHNFDRPSRPSDAKSSLTAQPRKSTSSFDRTQFPPMGPAPVVNVPDYWQVQLDNGIDVFGIESYETPTVTISIAFEGGVLLDPVDKAGLASLTASIMNETTLNFSNEKMANELEKLGSSISISSGGRYTTLNISSLRKNLEATLALAQEKLLNPAFSNDDFQRLKARLIQSKNQQKNNPSTLAAQARGQVLFGENNRVSLLDTGSLETVNNLSLDDIKTYYSRFYTSAKASVVSVGAVSQKDILEKLAFLNQLNDTDYDIPGYLPFPEYNDQSIFLVNKPDAVQSVIKIVTRSNPYDATGEYFTSQLMNFALGSAFNSRINLNLREEKSITYGASANFIGGKSLGWYEASADVIQDSTALAISEIFEEIKTYKNEGIKPEELTFMKNAYTQSDALEYETPASKAGFLRRLSAFGLSPDFKAQQLDIIKSMTVEKINNIAQKQLNPEHMQIIVVGNAEKIMPQLESLSIPIKTLDLASEG